MSEALEYHMTFEPRHQNNLFSGFSTRSDTNRDVQPQKMVRGLKFRFHEVDGLNYLCSKNKGTDQLRGSRAADLPLSFCICKK